MPFDAQGNYYDDDSQLTEFDANSAERNPLEANPQLALQNPPPSMTAPGPWSQKAAASADQLAQQGNVRPALWRSLAAAGTSFMLGRKHPQAAQAFGDVLTQTDPNVRANANLQQQYKVQEQQAQQERLQQTQQRMEQYQQGIIGLRTQAERDRLENQQAQRLDQATQHGFTPSPSEVDVPSPTATPGTPAPLQMISSPTMRTPLPKGALPPLAPIGSTPAQVSGQQGYFIPPDEQERRKTAAKGVTITEEDAAAAGRPELAGQVVPQAVYNTVIKRSLAPKSELGDRIPQLNKAMEARWQVLHPGQPLPEHYKIPDTASEKDYTRINQSMEGEERAYGVKSHQDEVAATRKATQAQNAITPEDARQDAEDLFNKRIAPEQFIAMNSSRGEQGRAYRKMVQRELRKLDPNFDWQEASASYALVKSPGFQNTIRYMGSVQESLPRLVENAQKLANGNVRSINSLMNAGKDQFNNIPLKRFQTDRLLLADEVAKILQGGGTGSGTSDAKLQQAGSILKDSDDPAALAAAADEINTLIGYRKKALVRGTYYEKPEPGPGSGTTGAATMVNMKAPDGTVKRVPADQVDHYLKLGAQRVQ